MDPSAPRFAKLPNGVRYQELNVGGSGPTAGPGDTVLFDYVLRRSNGYFIYGTVEGVSFQPRDIPTTPVAATLGRGELIPVRGRGGLCGKRGAGLGRGGSAALVGRA